MNIKELRKRAMKKAKEKTREALFRKDKLVIEAIEAVDDLDAVSNLLGERVKSWYSYHFPELDKLVKNMETYLAIVKDLKNRKYMQIARLAAHTGKAEKVAMLAKESVGADIPDSDLDQVAKLAGLAIDAKKMRNELMDYVSKTCKELCPNMVYLVGDNLAARLISHAGGLDKLAEMPASTIQILGAEKALFAHLKKKTKPPKHGIIFLYPAVKKAPKRLRGRIARALAAKIAIAARTDYFSGGKDFIGDKLKREVEERTKEVLGAGRRELTKPSKKTSKSRPSKPKPSKSKRHGRKNSKSKKRRV